MGWSTQSDRIFLAKRAILIDAIVVFFMLLIMARGSLLTWTGKQLMLELLIGFAAPTVPLIYLLFRPEQENSRKLAVRIFLLTIIAAVAFLIGAYAVASAMSYVLNFDIAGMLVTTLILSIIGFVIVILWVGALTEIIGWPILNRARNIFGPSRSEKVKLGAIRFKKSWDQYKESKAAMFALYILIIFSIVAIIGPAIAPENPMASKTSESFTPQPPSLKYWLGTDYQSKDVLSQFLWGAGTTLVVGYLAAAISAVIGTATGLVAGYYGRALDEILMRLTDFFLVIPWFPLMIVLMAILGRNIWIVIIVIGVVSWAPNARVVRAQVLSLKERMFIERARALGANNAYILRRHIFPNVFPMIVATTILLVGNAIFSEAFLDFFGLGDPNVVGWGWILERCEENSAMLHGYWWWIMPPSIGIILVIAAFYLAGDTVDEILNPRLKRR